MNEYIDLSDISADELGNLLTMKTCEVEKVEPFLPWLKDFTVAAVEDVKPHHDADKLVICRVNTGSSEIQIVTGAPNVVAGRKYPLAAVGSTLPNGMTMKKAKLRGEESHGMLCSAEELALNGLRLSDDEDPGKGILTLPDSFKTGATLAEAFGSDDQLIDIDNKSITHRPDLWGHYGFAREIAAITGKKIKFNPLDLKVEENSEVNKKYGDVQVTIKDNAAISYCSAPVSGVRVTVSELKMQLRLIAAGMRPINNIVDVSNYVMLESGQPNHAFDRKQIEGPVTISYSKKDEKITTLDSKEHQLPAGISLIRDNGKPVALAGVMGGEDTEVTAATEALFLESATFHRSDIRRAVSELSIRTDASQRFEKGQTPANAAPAIRRFVNLIKATCPEADLGTIQEDYSEELKENTIEISYAYIYERLGRIELSEKRIKEILESLGIEVSENNGMLTLKIPSYRSYFDLTLPEDIVEEIGRIEGYNRCELEPVLVRCEVPQDKNRLREIEHKLRDLMSLRYHFNEVYNYAFHSEEDIALDRYYSKDEPVRLQNPIQSDIPFMRISPLPSLIKNVAKYYREYDVLRYFEIERIFLPSKEKETLPDEKEFIAGIIRADGSSAEAAAENLAYLSAILSDMLSELGIQKSEQVYLQSADEVFHPGRCGRIIHRKSEKTLIRWGELHPKLVEEQHLPKGILYFDGLIADLIAAIDEGSTYRPVPRFPASDFEVTVLAERTRPFAELAAAVGPVEDTADPAADKTYLADFTYLTSFEGGPISPGKKAVSIKVQWRNRARTLEGKEIEKLQQKLIERLEKAGFALRS